MFAGSTLVLAFVVLALFVADGDDGRHNGRTATRRDRQLREISALTTRGHHERALGLSLEHAAEFPDDEDLLAVLLARRSGITNREHTTKENLS